jgi:hypothetical protein
MLRRLVFPFLEGRAPEPELLRRKRENLVERAPEPQPERQREFEVRVGP